jgi:hypothetical protein
MKILVVLSILLSLSACTPALEARSMVPMTEVYSQIPANKELERKIKLEQVSVYENAGAGIAPVTAQAYREALQNALLTANFLIRADDQERYTLDARLVALDVPTFGFTMTASATAVYTLKVADSGETILQETVSLPYKAEFGEAFNGAERARIAVAKAVRENITHMLRILAAKTNTELKPHLLRK